MAEQARQCPWCDGTDTRRIGEAGSLLMTEQWFCEGCSSAFEVIRKRGSETDDRDADRDGERDGDDDAHRRGGGGRW